MATIRISLTVNGVEKAGQDIPVRKARILGDDLAPDGTIDEQAQAIIDWLVSLRQVAAAPSIGSRDYDLMLAKVSEADPTWTPERVQAEGMNALAAAYDLL